MTAATKKHPTMAIKPSYAFCTDSRAEKWLTIRSWTPVLRRQATFCRIGILIDLYYDDTRAISRTLQQVVDYYFATVVKDAMVNQTDKEYRECLELVAIIAEGSRNPTLGEAVNISTIEGLDDNSPDEAFLDVITNRCSTLEGLVNFLIYMACIGDAADEQKRKIEPGGWESLVGILTGHLLDHIGQAIIADAVIPAAAWGMANPTLVWQPASMKDFEDKGFTRERREVDRALVKMVLEHECGFLKQEHYDALYDKLIAYGWHRGVMGQSGHTPKKVRKAISNCMKRRAESCNQISGALLAILEGRIGEFFAFWAKSEGDERKENADRLKSYIEHTGKIRKLYEAKLDWLIDQNSTDDVEPELIVKPIKSNAAVWNQAPDYWSAERGMEAFRGLSMQEWVDIRSEQISRHLELVDNGNPRNRDFIRASSKACGIEFAVNFYDQGRTYYKCDPAITAELMDSEVNVPSDTLLFEADAFHILGQKKSGVRRRVRRSDEVPTGCLELSHVSVMILPVFKDPDTPGQFNLVLRKCGIMMATSYTGPLCEKCLVLETYYNNVDEEKGTIWESKFRECQMIMLSDARTLEECWLESPRMIAVDGQEPVDKSEAWDFAIFKLAVSVMFFSMEQHEFIQPDIPRKLVTRYNEARKKKDPTEEQKVIDEAKKRGHTGKIFREIELPRDVVRYANPPNRDPENKRGPLQYGHFRRAYRRIRRGKPEFVKKTRVRPDLPLKPFTGYALTDNLVERKKKYLEQKGAQQ